MEQKLGREGHRQRMRKNYISNGIDAMEDHNVLELFLSLVIPQKDVKPLAYDLINNFGSLEGVMNADVEALMQIKGIGESSAVALSLIKDINNRAICNKNKGINRLKDSNISKEYVTNILQGELNERIILITLDNSLSIIKVHTLANGAVNEARIEPKKIIESAVKDNAASVIIAHNHPNGDCIPSAADINFTLNVIGLLRNINVFVNDHIIVGKHDTLSMKTNAKYMMYFDNK